MISFFGKDFNAYAKGSTNIKVAIILFISHRPSIKRKLFSYILPSAYLSSVLTAIISSRLT